jgi:ABC-type nitrate/sulfonate/bicarbonate transport system substrate-binding protein
MRRSARLLYSLGVLSLALATLTSTAAPAAAPAAAAALPPAAPGLARAPDAAQQLVPVRFGSPGSISDSGVIIGRAMGYFREQGLDVDTLPMQSGSDLIAPLASGELEAGGGTFSIALLNAIQRGVGLRIVADKGNSRQGFQFSQLPIRKDLMDSGEVRQLSDLRGRKLAVSATRAGSEAVLAHILGRAGMGVDDVDVQVLGYPDMLTALGNRAIDGGIIIEPFIAAAVDRGLVSTWEQGYSGDAYGGVYQAGVLIFSGRFAEQTDQARRFMIGYLRGVRAYNDAFAQGQNRAEMVRLLAEQTNVKDVALYDRMQMAGLDPDGRLNRASLQMELDYFRNRGYYTGSVGLSSAIDASFAEYAAQQLGPYR